VAAVVTVLRADETVESILAERHDDGRFYALTDLYLGDIATVLPGGVTDIYGEVNGSGSPSVAGTRTPL
jgi:hypothetical protein